MDCAAAEHVDEQDGGEDHQLRCCGADYDGALELALGEVQEEDGEGEFERDGGEEVGQ